MTNLDPYLAVYFITFVVLILLEVPIAYAMLASAFEFIVFNHQSFVMFAQKTPWLISTCWHYRHSSL